ncbi:response regulator transcription factor [Campylobacter sp. JMF_01 NE2]|nr:MULTISPECIES: response regulator transcription factor [unclassified Campylobacter]MDA3043128.1 response regulator transcription factor [Campylobacter sp. JMF_09 ED2]MDA3044834.1 response regulator transcription factor [Campylobacter sp. JMF_07 ED4]MDA3045901.1 response regulator transcription factor [Campylobacter sp. VBCF_06 NA8]MDA3052118.1 response regulator transcription factor [Campylobacter sp. JMF_03 NE3]MDA3054506.1 response regulator transcription factor [Campylobacter sp. VBCF_07 
MSDILKNLSILLVEDESKMRNSLRNTFEGIFKNVYEAKDGVEGLKKFKKYNPNLVVTDILMPIEDGLEMTRQIKQISPDTPVVVLSGFSEKAQLLGAIEAGVAKYFIKPVDMEEFKEAIKSLMSAKLSVSSVVEISGGYSFDPLKRVLTHGEEEISLTKKELAFISLLVSRIDTLVLHEEIKRYVWANDNSVSDVAIRTFIKRIRDKIGADVIKNIPSLGYKIESKKE